MSISSALRGIGRGARGIGSMIQQAVAPVPQEQPGASQEMVAPQEQAPTAPKGFSLPDLGPGPDPNDPQYADAAGQQKYATDLADFQHKQEIHQHFADLDSMFQKLHPQRDFRGEYEQELAEQSKQSESAPQASGLARAALALGDFNPATQKEGRSGLAEYDKNIADQQASHSKVFSQRMILRQKMHEQAAEEAEKAGNWRKALAEREKAALMAADSASLAHKRDMEKTGEVIKGQNQRAQIRADALRNTAELRMQSIGSRLEPSLRTIFLKEAAKKLAEFLGPEALNKTYDRDEALGNLVEEFEALSDALEHKQPKTTVPGTVKTAPAPKAKGGLEDF